VEDRRRCRQWNLKSRRDFTALRKEKTFFRRRSASVPIPPPPPVQRPSDFEPRGCNARESASCGG
jgi:hypothetical protein